MVSWGRLFFCFPPWSECGSQTHQSRLVWCWGWDGAGDLDGPDVDPIWEEQVGADRLTCDDKTLKSIFVDDTAANNL